MGCAAQVASQLVVAARELNRDPQLESLMRARRPEFGTAEGSRLDRVSRAGSLIHPATDAVSRYDDAKCAVFQTMYPYQIAYRTIMAGSMSI
jgi:hypothetical protein